MNNILGNRIKSLREEKDLSQLELSKVLNINNSTLSQYEAGNRVPSDEIKKQIASYFGVTLDYLMGVSNIRNPYQPKTIAAHHDGDEFTEEELQSIEQFKEFVKNRRKNKHNKNNI